MGQEFQASKVERPWGYFELLKQEDNFWIKILYIKPLQRISLQSHEKREEHWTIINGEGVATISNERGDEKGIAEQGTKIFIPKQTCHRIFNFSKSVPLIICEVAIGDCDESDIERYDDDYNRDRAEGE